MKKTSLNEGSLYYLLETKPEAINIFLKKG